MGIIHKQWPIDIGQITVAGEVLNMVIQSTVESLYCGFDSVIIRSEEMRDIHFKDNVVGVSGEVEEILCSFR
mgnify:CR=1 FL=1